MIIENIYDNYYTYLFLISYQAITNNKIRNKFKNNIITFYRNNLTKINELIDININLDPICLFYNLDIDGLIFAVLHNNIISNSYNFIL